MPSTPSREILWNVNSLPAVVTMYALFAVALLVAASGVLRRVELYCSGRADDRLTVPSPGELLKRWGDLFENGLGQRKVARPFSPAAVAHILVYIGFLALLFATSMVFVDHDLGIEIYRGHFYLAVTVMSDLLGLGVIFGCAIFAQRRYLRPVDMAHTRSIDGWFLGSLVLMCVQGYVLEGLRIHVTGDPWAIYSPVGLAVAKLAWGLSPSAAKLLHLVTWWFHAVTVFAAIGLLPYTKLFHVLASSANLFLERSLRPRGAVRSDGDIMGLMERESEPRFGLSTIKDYTWKQLLELDACTSCGRCQDACPAYRSGKPLSPKWVVLDTRNHALALHAKGAIGSSHMPEALRRLDGTLLGGLLLGRSGLTPQGDHLVYEQDGTFRAKNEAVQKAALQIGGSADALIAGEVINPETFWSCTTCMACVEVCPVGINHVDQIVGNRQSMALMRGELPHEAQATLRALENRGNPYGDPADRIKWAHGLELPILKAGDKVDYLYWVGCVSAYDARKQKIARSLVQIMQAAGLSFGVLGVAEGCSGDPARRLGEENLFQSMAKQNIELLRSISFKYVVANCPHCFNTIKNEYPQFGNLADGAQPQIIHHTMLLKELLAEQKIRVKDSQQALTFHDPCYLGRGNGEYDAPRDTLRSVKGLRIIEMEESREKGMCCGAGGGHFWMDLKNGERINKIRTDQAAATGAKMIATGCPFCLHMMEDGVKLTQREEQGFEVRDIAEVIAANLITGEEEPAEHGQH